MELVVKHFDQLNTEELYEILKIRTAVFVVEQNCPYLEVDGQDQQACHVFLRDESGIRAYLRILPKEEGVVQIGRVLTVNRGVGLGGEVLRAGLETVRQMEGVESVYIEAQTYAIGFYDREGFVVTSEEFLEDGIPHVQMILAL